VQAAPPLLVPRPATPRQHSYFCTSKASNLSTCAGGATAAGPEASELHVRQRHATGAQFTCFTGTAVRMLTSDTLQVLSLLALLVQQYEC
jgi:hypothetical protein